jgi:hypothetical protein
MATALLIHTSAPREAVTASFQQAFFTPGTFADRFKLGAAQFRAMFTWKQISHEDAAIAAQVVQAKGAREALSRKNGKSEVGVIVAMAFEQSNSDTTAQIWLARHRTFMGMSNESDVLKVYTNEICKDLNGKGYSASVAKAPKR